MRDRMGKTLMLCAAIALVCLSGLAAVADPTAVPGNNALGIVPPPAHFAGHSYAEWGAKFWQWSYSMPVDAHPLFGTADISAGQSGPVWFIGGTFAATEPYPGEIVGTADRSGTIPSGKALFFPILNAEASTLEGNGTTAEELTAAAQFFNSFVDIDSLFCEVDGVAATRLGSYTALSPAAIYGPLPENSVLASQGYPVAAGDTSAFVADGYYVMLRPLPVGVHTIHFGGTADYTDAFGFTFSLDITYTITVVGQR
jgi:hypothetical protein